MVRGPLRGGVTRARATRRGQPDEGGLTWTPADIEHPSAQAHAAEVLQVLRGWRAEGIDLADPLAVVRRAYDGDLAES